MDGALRRPPTASESITRRRNVNGFVAIRKQSQRAAHISIGNDASPYATIHNIHADITGMDGVCFCFSFCHLHEVIGPCRKFPANFDEHSKAVVCYFSFCFRLFVFSLVCCILI